MKSVKKTCASLLCGTLWHIKDSDFDSPQFEEILRGAIAVGEDGRILAMGKASDLKKNFSAKKEYQFDQSVLLPGFVDTHIHFPQMFRVGCYGESLLGWLEKYIFPEEERMSQGNLAAKYSPLFFRELFKGGTTTSMIVSNSDLKTTHFLFEAAKATGARAIIGKASMDRMGPKSILRGTAQDKEETYQLIEKWQGEAERLYYAITPRFSPACSLKTLKMLGQLSQEYPTLRVQTHFAETLEELKLVRESFPNFKDYLATYEEHGLIHNRTVLAHAIFATSHELKRIKTRGAHISHCPTSNMFLGSGLYPLEKFSQQKTVTSIGTDVGAGTSFSIWSSLAAAYQVQRLRGGDITPGQLFHMATLSGAQALGLEDHIGNFNAGKFADVQVLDWSKSPILRKNIEHSQNPLERFFATLFQFERGLISDVFIQGKKVTD